MATEIKTSIKINATPEQVWNVFSDFESYKNWNPFISSLTGDVVKGKTIQVSIPGMNFKPEILAFEKNKELRWKGKLLFKGVFDGEHYFQLEENKDGTTTFHHGENFSGFLVRFFKNKLMTETKSGFESMNLKLKERVESKYNA